MAIKTGAYLHDDNDNDMHDDNDNANGMHDVMLRLMLYCGFIEAVLGLYLDGD